MDVEGLARELGVGVGRVIDLCDQLGIRVEARTSVLSDDELTRVRSAVDPTRGTGTLREAPGGASTRRESTGDEPIGTGTRREQSQVTSAGSGWLQLPAELSSRFTLERELRHGAEGFVVVVRERAGEQWVLKGYHHGIEVDAASLEALSGPAIDHDHIVVIAEFGLLADGTFYELQEHCPLGSLREVLESGAPMDFDTVARELSSALRYVHELGIVHRDIKPENVLVRSLEPLDLVLADFGLVRQVAGSVRRTARAGTAEYTPPEGVADRVDVSPAWD